MRCKTKDSRERKTFKTGALLLLEVYRISLQVQMHSVSQRLIPLQKARGRERRFYWISRFRCG
jgi:hypothetical protein